MGSREGSLEVGYYDVDMIWFSVPSRFERQHSNSQHDPNIDSDMPPGSHASVSTPSSTGSGSSYAGLGKPYLRNVKKTKEYDDGYDSFQNEPSGWGELPSPKPSDLDNGTEFWGVPPDDLERQLRAEKKRISHSSSSAGPSSDLGEQELQLNHLLWD